MTDTAHPTPPTASPEGAARPIDAIVAGAGLGGLLCATRLALEGHAVTLIEPRNDGGRAQVDRRGGYAFNRGPRALYRGGRADQALRAVGVDTSHGAAPVLAGAGASHRGIVHRFPGGATDTARTRLLRAGDKLVLARTLAAIVSGVDDADQLSVAEWLDRRRLRGTLRQLLEALVRLATYANAPDHLAAGVALRSVRAGIKPGVRYLDGGWQGVIDQLGERVGDLGVTRLRGAVQRVDVDRDVVIVHTDDRAPVRARSVVLAVGGPEAAASVLGGRPGSWPTLSPAATASCLELGLRTPPPRRFVLGVDEPTYLSTHAPPAQLAPDGHAVVHVMRYRQPGDELDPDATLAQLREVAASAGIAEGDIAEQRFLARMVVTGAIPTPDRSGALGRPPVAVAEHPGVFVVGDWVGSTGVLADAVAASADEASRLAGARSATMDR